MSYSQVGQDNFVLETLKYKTNGYYLEIGANHPIYINNTFLLENKYKWIGLSLEIDNNLAKEYNKVRINKCIAHDAVTFNYENYFIENNFPNTIDYLSLDIEPPEQTFNCLLNLPFKNYIFSIITYEHEFYYAGSKYRDSSREFLKDRGYKLAVEDVRCPNGNIFEDWYIHESIESSLK